MDRRQRDPDKNATNEPPSSSIFSPGVLPREIPFSNIKSADTGARYEIDANGIRYYDANENPVIDLGDFIAGNTGIPYFKLGADTDSQLRLGQNYFEGTQLYGSILASDFRFNGGGFGTILGEVSGILALRDFMRYGSSPDYILMDGFEATAGWTATNATIATNATHSEGTLAVKVTPTSASLRPDIIKTFSQRDFGGAATDPDIVVQLDLNPSFVTIAGDFEIRFENTSGNYFTWPVPAGLPASTWSRITIPLRHTTKVGSPVLSTRDKVRIIGKAGTTKTFIVDRLVRFPASRLELGGGGSSGFSVFSHGSPDAYSNLASIEWGRLDPLALGTPALSLWGNLDEYPFGSGYTSFNFQANGLSPPSRAKLYTAGAKGAGNFALSGVDNMPDMFLAGTTSVAFNNVGAVSGTVSYTFPTTPTAVIGTISVGSNLDILLNWTAAPTSTGVAFRAFVKNLGLVTGTATIHWLVIA